MGIRDEIARRHMVPAVVAEDVPGLGLAKFRRLTRRQAAAIDRGENVNDYIDGLVLATALDSAGDPLFDCIDRVRETDHAVVIALFDAARRVNALATTPLEVDKAAKK